MLKNRSNEFWVIVITTLVVAITTSYALANGVAIPPPSIIPTNDPILTYLQAAGFPAWAGVVAWGVMHITNEMRSFTQKLDTHIAYTNDRLYALEELILNKNKQI